MPGKWLTGALVATAILATTSVEAQTRPSGYFALGRQAVTDYYSHLRLNLTCSTGTWISGPHTGLSEHITHIGPLGYCGILLLGSGDYHIISVQYYAVAGNNPNVPSDPAWDGKDPRATAWRDLVNDREHRATDWRDADGSGTLSPGDWVSFDDGVTAPIGETGTAAGVESAKETTASKR